jgi:O-antigen/teichoic acid export membrane protein
VPAGQPWVTVALTFAILSYALHATLAGGLAGRAQWGIFARLMSAEALVRLFAVMLCALLLPTLEWLQLAALGPIFVWLIFILLSSRARAALFSRGDYGLVPLLRHHGYALATAAANAALIVGFPILFGITSSREAIAASAGLLLAVQLTRAPILIPLQAFQGVAIASFVNQRSEGVRPLVRPALLILSIAFVGAILAAIVGPMIMLIFGPRYVVGGITLGLLTLSAGGLGILTLTGAATLAIGNHRFYLLGWLSATGAGFALLFLPLETTSRVVLSLCLAPIVGIAMHIVGLRLNRQEMFT